METLNSDHCCDEVQSNDLPMASSEVNDSCSMKDCVKEGAIQLSEYEIELLEYRVNQGVKWSRICKEHYRFLVSGYESIFTMSHVITLATFHLIFF